MWSLRRQHKGEVLTASEKPSGAVTKGLRKAAVGLVKEYAPEVAIKFILESIRGHNPSEMLKLAEERRNLFLETWEHLPPVQRRKIRNFLSHLKGEIQPIFSDAGMVRRRLCEEAQRIKAKRDKGKDDDAALAYINFILNSPSVFRWICWMAASAGDAFFGEETPAPKLSVKLELDEAPPKEAPEPAAPFKVEGVPYGQVIGEDKEAT